MNGEAGGVYDPSDLTAEKVAWRRNLWLYSEPTSATGYLVSNATFTTDALFNFLSGGGACIELADATVNRSAGQTYTLTAGVTYTLSFYVTIAGGGLPNSGSGSYRDFTITRDNSDVTNYALITYDDLGGGVYRAKHTWLHTATSPTIRVVKYSGLNTNTAVRFTGIQLDVGPTATAYQRITDFTSDFLAAFPTHGLYQDTAGTTPVTALAQPVGLVIDSKTGGLANLGPELVTNGNFEFGLIGIKADGTSPVSVSTWTLNTTAPISGTQDGRLTITTSAGGRPLINFSSAVPVLTQHARYVVAFDYKVLSGTFILSEMLLAGTFTTLNRSLTGSGRTFLVMPAGANTTDRLYIYSGNSVCDVQIDNISVREVPGVHAIQPTSSSRPLLDGRVNLLERSDEFDNAYWVKADVSISANATTAPDGTATADKMVEAATTGNHWFYRSSTLPATASFVSLYAKASERSRIAVGNASLDQYATFNLSDGTVISAGTGTISGGAIESAGNGWYRVSCIAQPTVANALGVFILNNSNQRSYTGDGTSGLFVWRADVRLLSDAAYPAQRVAAATDYADVGVPRSFLFDGFDDSLYTASNMEFATVTSDGLARRNLLTNPSQFDAAGWVLVNSTVTANSAIAPDGTATAEKLVEDTATNVHTIVQSAFPAITTGATYTFSIFAKAAERTLICLRDNGTTNSGVFFDLSNGVVTSQEAAVSAASAIAAGNGWYRCIVTYTAGTTTANPQPRLVSTGTTQSYTGNGTSGLFIWGAQLEAGSTATAFQNIGTDKVTVLAGVRKLSDAAVGVLAETSATATATNGCWLITAPDGAGIRYGVGVRGTNAVIITTSAAAFTAPVTNVLTLIGNIAEPETTLRANGAVAVTNAGSLGTGNFSSQVLYIGRRNNTSFPFNGKAYQLIVRGALTDAATLAQAERYVAKKTGVTI